MLVVYTLHRGITYNTNNNSHKLRLAYALGVMYYLLKYFGRRFGQLDSICTNNRRHTHANITVIMYRNKPHLQLSVFTEVYLPLRYRPVQSLVFDSMVCFQDETDSIAETESDRTDMKRDGDGEREGGAINLTSRPSSAPTTTHTDADNEVNAPFSAQKTYKFTKLGHLKFHSLRILACIIGSRLACEQRE